MFNFINVFSKCRNLSLQQVHLQNMKIFLTLGFLFFLVIPYNSVIAKENKCIITINYKNNFKTEEQLLFHTLDIVPRLIDKQNLVDENGKISFIYNGDDTWSQITMKNNKYFSISFITSSEELIFNLDCEKKTFEVVKSNKKTQDFERTNDELRAFLLNFKIQQRLLDSLVFLKDSTNTLIKKEKLRLYFEDGYMSFIAKARNEPFYQISALIAVHLSKQCIINKLPYENECMDLYDFLINKFPNTATFSILKEEFERERKPYQIGKNFNIFDSLIFKNINGSLQSLDETIEKSNSNIIVLEFWASWCGPCRQNHPEIIKLSDKYPALEIIFISIDENDDNWFRAIQKDNLTKFRHLIDNTGWEARILKENNVSQIPFNVVLDNKRQIIGTNIYGSDLESLVKIISVK